MTGASLSASSTETSLALVFGLLVDDVLDRLVHAREPREQQVEILDGGGGGLDPPAGHHPDVVDREHVRGVGHRQQQRAVVGEADGHAPGSAWRP